MGYQTMSGMGFTLWDPIGSSMSEHYDREAERRSYFYSRKMAEIQHGYNKELMQSQQDFDAAQSALAFERSMGAFQNRYQTTVKDLKNAGINPLLAVNGMVGNSPTASAVSSSIPSTGLPTVSSYNSSGSSAGFDANNFASSIAAFRQQKATTERMEQEVKNSEKTENLIDAQILKTLQDTQQGEASTTKTKVDTYRDVAVPIAQTAATAYAGHNAGKAVKALVSAGLTKNSAKEIIKDVVPKASSSAKQAKNILPLLTAAGAYGLPALTAAGAGYLMFGNDKTSSLYKKGDVKTKDKHYLYQHGNYSR